MSAWSTLSYTDTKLYELTVLDVINDINDWWYSQFKLILYFSKDEWPLTPTDAGVDHTLISNVMQNYFTAWFELDSSSGKKHSFTILVGKVLDGNLFDPIYQSTKCENGKATMETSRHSKESSRSLTLWFGMWCSKVSRITSPTPFFAVLVKM